MHLLVRAVLAAVLLVSLCSSQAQAQAQTQALPPHLDPVAIIRSMGWDNVTADVLTANPIGSCRKFTSRDPDNVRKLRPADVKVLVGVGDSITAGFGITGLPVETRDESWSIGGASNAVTIATFIKHYNPNVIGFSVGMNAGLNTAVTGALISGVKAQLQTAVQRMKADSRINYERDWKLISILIGANNFCKSCNKESRHQPPAFLTELRAALEYAQQNIPKALISINGMLPLSPLKTAGDKNSHCQSIRFITANLCPCAFNSDSDARFMDNVIQTSNSHMQTLALEFNRKNLPSFNVVYQPGLGSTLIPDASFLSTLDCFHPNLKAHQSIAIGSWNQLITPLSRKPNRITLPPTLVCPAEDSLLYNS